MFIHWSQEFDIQHMPSADNRSKLYQNALELFYKKGYKATTMRDIADSMNFEAASLYNYIDSKHALLEELLFDVADQFLNGIIEIKLSADSPLEKLESIIALYVNITAKNPYKAALLISDWRNLNNDATTRFLSHRSTYEQHLKEIIAGHYATANINDLSIDVTLHAFLGATRWICDWYILQTAEIDPQALYNDLKLIILKGIAQPNL